MFYFLAGPSTIQHPVLN